MGEQQHLETCYLGDDCPLIPRWRKAVFPLTRYHLAHGYYCLVTNPRMDFDKEAKAELMIVDDDDLVNNFILGHGLKTIKTFYAESPIKALNKAKKYLKRVAK